MIRCGTWVTYNEKPATWREGVRKEKKIGGVKKLVAVKKIIQRECVVSAPFLLLDRR